MKPEFKELPFEPRRPEGEVVISEATLEQTKKEVLLLFDHAITWLNTTKGISSQWGTEPRSTDARFDARVKGVFDDSLVLQARSEDDQLLGVIGLSTQNPRPGFIPDAPEQEVYISVLIRNLSTEEVSQLSKGIGRIFVEQAKEIARNNGIRLLRVDCFGGEGGVLAKVYESYGFKKNPVDPILLEREGEEPWPMQILEMWL